MDQNRLNVTLGGEIAQSLQPWPQKTGAAKAFVLDHPVIGYAVALLACEVDQRRRLTGDRVLLLLLLGRWPSTAGSKLPAAGSRCDLVSGRGGLRRLRRLRGVELPIPLLDAASPLVSGNDDADVI